VLAGLVTTLNSISLLLLMLLAENCEPSNDLNSEKRKR
jgi:hypothetical protein